MKKLFLMLLAVVMCFSLVACAQAETNSKPTPVMCDSYYASADNFYISLIGAFRGNPPEVEAGKDSTPFLIRLTYTGEEGSSYALGDASDKTDQYLRFRMIYKDKYYFEEYKIYTLRETYTVRSGDVLEDLPFLHFEPLEEETELQLWMIVPEEVMDSDESLYFIVNVGEQEFWFDITDDDLNWYKDRL